MSDVYSQSILHSFAKNKFFVNYKGFPQIRLTFCDDVARIKSAAERQMQECHRHRQSSGSILGKAAAPRTIWKIIYANKSVTWVLKRTFACEQVLQREEGKEEGKTPVS